MGPPYDGRVRFGGRSAALVCAVAALLAVTACSGDSGNDAQGDPGSSSADSAAKTSATPTPTPTAAPAPARGACYNLATSQLFDAHSSVGPVSCKGHHTTQTYLVTKLGAATIGDPDAINSAAIIDAADRKCVRALRAHLGANRTRLALSRFTYAWFVPQEADFKLGAKWLRCDVASRHGTSTLAALPRKTAHLLDSDEALNRWGTCAKASSRGLQAGKGQRICAAKHNWRAISIRTLRKASAPWPGDKAVRRGVLKRCEKAARSFTGNTTGTLVVGWLPPTRTQWQDDRRYGLCWAKTQ